MKRLILTLFAIISTLVLKAQPYGNEWIDYSQKYFYFQITQDGVYRIHHDTLVSAGIPLSSIDPRNIQLFGRGVEIPIHIEGENDGVFNASDFIEFYGQGNDGSMDLPVYDKPSSQSNPYYSLFNDTASYYLTWNNSTSNKRMKLETSINFGSYNKASYFFKESVNIESSTYYRGETVTPKNTDAQYVASEGLFGPVFTLGGIITKSFSTTNIYTAGPAALFKTIYTGQSNYSENPDHNITIEYKNNSGNFVLIGDTFFDGYKQIRHNMSIPASALNATQTDFRYTSVLSQNISGNRTAIAYSYLKFPHTFNLENQTNYKLTIPEDALGKSYLEITNFSASGAARLYDITNGKRITVVSASGFHRALVPNSGAEKQCYLTSDGQIKTITSLKSVSSSGQFTNFANGDADFLIITHQSLMDGANAYAAYRTNTGSKVIVVNIDDLYPQFSYGINKNPLAIRRFADYTLDTWQIKPDHLFLLGKALYADYYRTNAAYYAQTLVPSFGVPPSDVLLTAGLNGTTYEPAISTGRLAVKTNEEVMIYLNKMIEYETQFIEPPEWRKNIMHFGGGVSQSEQSVLAAYLNGYKQIIEDTLYGGVVHTFLKTSTVPVQITVSDSIKRLMNEGVSLITYFAHGTATTFDISIDDPANYDNKGKYPLIFANACLTGDIHLPLSNSTSEKQVFIEDKGVIGYIATVQDGYPPYLDLYAKEIYKNISYKLYGQSIGKIMKEVSKAIQDTGNIYTKDACFFTTLHGDPALKINYYDKSDIMVSQPNVYFEPTDITTELDSFSINVILTNLAKSVTDSFNVLVARVKPDGTTDTAFAWVNQLIYKDTLTLYFKIANPNEFGINSFDVYADYTGLISEVTEVNNKTSVFLNIKSNDIIPVYPYQYAVVPKQGIKLKANTSNPFALARNYVFEVDTTDLFNSPIKERTVINHAGGVVTWQPALLNNMPDSMVYFWRVSPDSTASNNFTWRESSFQYIQNKKGWGQAHFFQYKNDKFDLLEYDRPARRFGFESAVKEVLCRTPGKDAWSGQVMTPSLEWKLDAVSQEQYGCGLTPYIIVAVIDSVTLTSWGTKWYDSNTGITYNPNNDFGNANNMGTCKNRVKKYFLFDINAQGINSLVDMLQNKIPKGNYVLVYSFRQNGCQLWDSYNLGLHNVLESLGASGLRTLPDDYPFAFLAKVGYPSTAIQKLGTASNEVLIFQANIYNSFPYGDLSSDLIGPSKYWRSLHWRKTALENPSLDSVTINLSGIKADGTSNLIASFPSDSIDVLNLNNYVDAAVYPYIKLNAHLKDDSLQTSPQMRRWQVLYDEVPEAALNASAAFDYPSDSVSEGDNVKLKIAISNISEINMDSITLKYTLEDVHRNQTVLYYAKQAALPADSTLISDFEFNSQGFGGQNKLWVEINPFDSNWQLEQYHFNNVAQLNLNVEEDKINPLLDVTFDGTHILDGDIISAKPIIVIQLSDENKYLALNDTADFAVFIKDPAGNLKRISFVTNGSENMRFTPAVLPKNSCKIEYSSVFPTDGIYELRVQAKDASENSSGSYDYVIKFEVINRSTITEVVNYPNPFSTSTKFVFTLTGSEIPTQFKIQIMTITGKVVKEITQAELGTIRIGRNITEYAWDGKDEFGDPLGNGVYLYRVITKINGNAIEHKESEADQYFNHEFGKMYLMR